MKAVRFHKTGGPEVLVYDDVPNPTPKDGEVLVRIEAVGLNFADVMRRRGDPYPEASPPPFILGAEVAGTIAAVGNGVASLEVGMSVLAAPGSGGYAQYICVPAAIVIPLPGGISAIHAAALMAHGLTAALVLRKATRLASGESILIEAAAGGVGSFAVQLAKVYGAGKIIAAASTPEKRAIAERLGADASVDYTKPGWAEKVRELTGGRGVDIVLEMTGGVMLGAPESGQLFDVVTALALKPHSQMSEFFWQLKHDLGFGLYVPDCDTTACAISAATKAGIDHPVLDQPLLDLYAEYQVGHKNRRNPPTESRFD